MPNRQCAPSRSPDRILSRIVAHDASRETSTSRPCFLYRPSSCAITTDAQSVSGMKPILILLSAAFVVIAASLFAQELKVEEMPAKLLAAMAAFINARRFMIEPDSFLYCFTVVAELNVCRRANEDAAQWQILTVPSSGAPVRRAA